MTEMRNHIHDAIRHGIPMVEIDTADSWHDFDQLLGSRRYDAIVSGLYYYNDIEGLAYNRIFDRISSAARGIPVIFLGKYVKPQHVFDAAKKGAFDFMLLDPDFQPNELVASVKSAVELHRIPRIFISYSSDDRAFAKELASSMHKHGFQVWYDEWEIHVGDAIIQKIESGIVESSYLVIVLSPASVSSRWVREELDSAITSQITDYRIRVLPALKDDCAIPPFLKSKKYADFRHDFTEGFVQLINAVKADRKNTT
jgi:CheY-like chemotaxis protein